MSQDIRRFFLHCHVTIHKQRSPYVTKFYRLHRITLNRADLGNDRDLQATFISAENRIACHFRVISGHYHHPKYLLDELPCLSGRACHCIHADRNSLGNLSKETLDTM